MVEYEKNEQPLFVAYDITSNKIRKKVLTACEDFGLRPVQFSVFFGFLTARKRKELENRLSMLISDTEGNYISIPLERKMLGGIKADGEVLGVSHASIMRFI